MLKKRAKAQKSTNEVKRGKTDSKWIISPHFNWSNGIRFSKNIHTAWELNFKLRFWFLIYGEAALTNSMEHNLLSVYYDVNLCAEYTLDAIFITKEHSFVNT